MKELFEFAKIMKLLHPKLAEEIEDLVQLCISEIEEGGFEEHEISLYMEDIRQLVEEDEEL